MKYFTSIKYFGLFFMLFAFFLSGCQSTTSTVKTELKKQEETKKEQQNTLKKTVKKIPDWYEKLPDGKNVYVYTTGMWQSPLVQTAKLMAEKQALKTLAGSIDQRISSLTNEMIDQVGLNDDIVLTTEMTEVTRYVVAQAQVGGFSYVKTEIQEDGTNYIAYVLLQYPLGDANKILMQQIKKEQSLEAKVRASKAFQDLEDELSKLE